jgi:hypothetical protein
LAYKRLKRPNTDQIYLLTNAIVGLKYGYTPFIDAYLNSLSHSSNIEITQQNLNNFALLAVKYQDTNLFKKILNLSDTYSSIIIDVLAKYADMEHNTIEVFLQAHSLTSYQVANMINAAEYSPKSLNCVLKTLIKHKYTKLVLWHCLKPNTHPLSYEAIVTYYTAIGGWTGRRIRKLFTPGLSEQNVIDLFTLVIRKEDVAKYIPFFIEKEEYVYTVIKHLEWDLIPSHVLSIVKSWDKSLIIKEFIINTLPQDFSYRTDTLKSQSPDVLKLLLKRQGRSCNGDIRH